MLTTLIGWKVAGLLGALVATLALYVPCSMLCFGVARTWNRYRGTKWHTAIENGLRPIGAGLMIAGGVMILRIERQRLARLGGRLRRGRCDDLAAGGAPDAAAGDRRRDLCRGACGHAANRREPKQAGRIVNEDAIPGRLIRCDHGQQIQQIAFVGRASRRERISVRPIGTPDHTVWRGFDDRLGERDHVQERQASRDVGLGDRTDLVEAAQLHPEAVILQQVEKQPEGRLVETVLAPNARHVVDDGHRRERPDESLMFDEIRGIDMKNENPVELLQHG